MARPDQGLGLAVGVSGLENPPRPALWGAAAYHLHESVLHKAIHAAAREARVAKPVGPHTLRHGFATVLLIAGYDMRTVQELLGHRDVTTPYVPSSEAYRGMIYTHVLNRGGRGVESPVDQLLAGCTSPVEPPPSSGPTAAATRDD